MRAVAQAPRSGFETAIALPASTPGPYLAAQALDGAGRVLGTTTPAAEPGLAAGR
jgi:hypothetical protein